MITIGEKVFSSHIHLYSALWHEEENQEGRVHTERELLNEHHVEKQIWSHVYHHQDTLEACKPPLCIVFINGDDEGLVRCAFYFLGGDKMTFTMFSVTF